MGLSFLAPFFFAGIAMLAAPYIIHQIRRPEREPLRFSSVLFIPNVPKEIIERRRIQHLLLMLLRMLLFLLLALAFTRPYWKALAANDLEDAPSRHLVLLDTSYSMGREGLFEKAKDAALNALDEVKPGEQVAVIAYARAPHLIAEFATPEDPEAGTPERARQAIRAAVLTEEETAYLPALQFGQQLLLANVESEINERRVLHLVSDFQKSGMPDRFTGWKVASTIELNPVRVEIPEGSNIGITDIGVKRSDNGELRVLGKIKNWSEKDADAVSVTLFVGEKEIASNTLSVKAGNASQTSFKLTAEGDGPVEGYLALGRDVLQADNRRYFTWNPPRKRTVALVGDDAQGERFPAAWFFEKALPNDADLPWTTSLSAPGELEARLTNPGTRPHVVIVASMEGWEAESAKALLDYIRGGGQALVTLNAAADPDALNSLLLSELGFPASGLRFQAPRENRYVLLSWVDFEHPVFASFQGSRFNDFSSLRFYNHWVVTAPEGQEGIRTLARFDDDDSSPAIVERSLGAGRIILWPFAVRLDWSNFPKSARFVPFLHETLAYLGDLNEDDARWQVGDRIPANALVVNAEGMSTVEIPSMKGTAELDAASASATDALVMRHAGFFRTRAQGEAAWQQVNPVNVDPNEGDPAVIEEAELELKLATAPILDLKDAEPDALAQETPDGFVIQTEYGRNFLLAVFAFLLIESWYMSWLKR